MMIRHALVTGASGFIGRELCRQLNSQGVDVVAMMRHAAKGPWQRVINLSLGTDSVPRAVFEGIDTVFHLAAKTHALEEKADHCSGYRSVNVAGTKDLFEASVAAGVQRFVYLSSVKAMGEGTAECVDESWPDQPQSPYGRTKHQAEEIVHDTGNRHGVHTSVLRPPLVYGPGAKGNLERMLKLIEGGLFPLINVADNKRSMVHVRDVVSAALACARDERARGQTYLVTDGEVYSLLDILTLMYRSVSGKVPAFMLPMWVLRLLAGIGDILNHISPRRIPFDSDFLDKLTGSACYNSEKIERELGFRPEYTLSSALPEIVAHFRNA